MRSKITGETERKEGERKVREGVQWSVAQSHREFVELAFFVFFDFIHLGPSFFIFYKMKRAAVCFYFFIQPFVFYLQIFFQIMAL